MINPALAAITVFAVIDTKIVDTFRNIFDPDARLAPWIWNLLAFAIGILFAFVFQLNALEAISKTPAQGTLGQVLTGFGIGAWGSGWHELLDALSSARKNKRA